MAAYPHPYGEWTTKGLSSAVDLEYLSNPPVTRSVPMPTSNDVPSYWPPPLTGSTRVEPQPFLRPANYSAIRDDFWRAFMYGFRDWFTIVAVVTWPWAMAWLAK